MTLQERVIKRARGQLGYRENPAGSNRTKFGSWYGMDGQPWCAMFATWAAVNEGSTALARSSRYAYVPYIEADARKGVHGLRKIAADKGKAGDLITFDWDSDGLPEHVGLIEKSLGGGDYQTIEGNTSDDNYSNGGEVMRRTRYASQVSMIVRYPNEAAGEEEGQMIVPGDKGNGVKHCQRALNAWSAKNDKGWKVTEDGTYEKGSAMVGHIKEFQKAFGLDQNGNIDGLTAAFLMRFDPA